MKKLALSFLLSTALFGINAASQKQNPTVNHIAFYVYNLQKGTAFYQQIIQLDTIPEPFHDGRHTWFKIGEHAQLHLIQGAKLVTPHEKNTHICFSVASMDAFIANLNKAKVPYEDWVGKPYSVTTRVDKVKQIYLQDPDGYWIEINDDKY